jgi:hypothetical protein
VILPDSSVWIDFLRNEPTAEATKLSALLTHRSASVLMGDIILAEILQGYEDERQARLVQQRLSSLKQVAICDPPLAIRASDNFRALRQRGVTIRKTIDTLIATRCIVDSHALLHRDRDFQPFVDHLGLIDAMTR